MLGASKEALRATKPLREIGDHFATHFASYAVRCSNPRDGQK
jgi:hypothetical protein